MDRKEILVIVLVLIVISNLIFVFSYFKPKITGGVVLESDIGSFPKTGFVSKVIDGDTVVINGESIRLLGIDADERGYPCYKESKKRLEELILNKNTRVEKEGENKDQYGRYLRYIFLNESGKEVNINLRLIEEGLAIARFFPDNKNYRKKILDAEKYAREKRVGCKWGGISKSERDKESNQDRNKESSLKDLQDTKIDKQEVKKEKLDKNILDNAISACNTRNYIGKTKIVEGKIVDSYKYKTSAIFLNLEKHYPNQCFTVVIWASEWYKFPENSEKYYDGKKVRIKGKIIEYKGRPEIILKDIEQIEIIGV